MFLGTFNISRCSILGDNNDAQPALHLLLPFPT